jgi:rhodanese-related sulfurtransferase
MPAKYLISRSISCNITNLRLASEKDLWGEQGDLIKAFLKTWKGVRSGEVDIISASLQKTSLTPGKKIVTYCSSGYRGNIAADELNKLGFDTVTIEGRYSAWKDYKNEVL